MIYLVRHGQTAFNRERRLQGHVDSDLTELGLAQADAVGRRLKGLVSGEAGWRIVASPLGRAFRTAGIIAGHLDLGVEMEPRLTEISFGEWDGRLRSELEPVFPDAFAPTGWTFRTPTGEPYRSVVARMTDWLKSLPPEPDRRVIAVSHGVAGRVLRGVYAGLNREETVTQEVPQDAVFRLAGGQVERIDCDLSAPASP